MIVLQSIAAFVLILGPLVFIHELGHFLVAKALRIGVPIFSLGFGPRDAECPVERPRGCAGLTNEDRGQQTPNKASTRE